MVCTPEFLASMGKEPIRPGASFRRTVSQSLATAEDRLGGAASEGPVAAKKEKRGVFVAFGDASIAMLKPFVAALPRPSSPGSSAGVHDAMNLVFMLFFFVMSLDYIANERQTVWQFLVCAGYFVMDTFWLAWDTECVRQ